jgi:hypothetical protein
VAEENEDDGGGGDGGRVDSARNGGDELEFYRKPSVYQGFGEEESTAGTSDVALALAAEMQSGPPSAPPPALPQSLSASVEHAGGGGGTPRVVLANSEAVGEIDHRLVPMDHYGELSASDDNDDDDYLGVQKGLVAVGP